MGKRLRSGFYRRGDGGSGVIWVRTDPIDKLPRSTGARDPDAAYLWRAERERIASSPTYAASLAASFGDWVLKMIELKTATRSAGTVHMYGVKLGHFVRIWGDAATLASVDAGAVDDFVTQRRKEGAGSNTISRELTCLRQLLRHAKRAGQYAADLDQVMPIGFSAEYVPVTRTLAFADFPKLWAALRDDTERAYVALALGLGMDHGDIERARSEDYDPARGVWKVRGTKTAVRAAEVPVLPHVRELVEFALPHLPISWPRASKGVGEACRRAGLHHLSPKDLRRTASSWLMASGADQTHVSRFLRHKGDAMVRKVYGQLSPEELGSLLTGSAETLQRSHGPLGGTADAGDLKGEAGGAEGVAGKGNRALAGATDGAREQPTVQDRYSDDPDFLEWCSTLAEHFERAAAFAEMGSR
jgi:integrase